METICSSCGAKNKSTNIMCENCGERLDQSLASAYEALAGLNAQAEEYYAKKDGSTLEIVLKNKELLVKILYIVFSFPIWFIAFAMIIFGGLFFVTDQTKIKGYEKTIGTLVTYTDYGYFFDTDKLCKAVYKYEVNGKKYQVTTSYYTTEEGFKEQINVMYNPNKPSQSYALERWYVKIIITGVVILLIVILIHRIINKKIKSQENKKSDAIMHTEQ